MAIEVRYPDALLASAGLSGGVANIDDDPATPDALWLTAPGSNTATSARTSFPTPTGDPRSGAGLQTFRVQVRKTAQSTNPTVQISLYEGGSLLAALGSATAVSSTTGTVLTRTWDAGLLADPTGAGVEILIQGTPGGGNPSNRASVEIGAVAWDVDYTVPSVTFNRAAVVSAVSAASASRLVSRARAAVVSAVSAASASRGLTRPRSAAVSSTSSVSATASRVLSRAAAVVSASVSTATAEVIRSRAGIVASASAVLVSRDVIRNRAAAVASVSSVTAASPTAVLAAATVVSASSVTAAALIIRSRAVSVSAVSAVSVSSQFLRNRGAQVSAGASVAAVYVRAFARTAHVASISGASAYPEGAAEGRPKAYVYRSRPMQKRRLWTSSITRRHK